MTIGEGLFPVDQRFRLAEATPMKGQRNEYKIDKTKLQALLDANDWTLADLARESGVNDSTLRTAVNRRDGKAHPDNVQLIADALKVDVSYLTSGRSLRLNREALATCMAYFDWKRFRRRKENPDLPSVEDWMVRPRPPEELEDADLLATVIEMSMAGKTLSDISTFFEIQDRLDENRGGGQSR